MTSRYQHNDFLRPGRELARQTDPLDKKGDVYHVHLEFTNGDTMLVAPTSWSDAVMVADAVEGPARNIIIQFHDVRALWIEEV